MIDKFLDSKNHFYSSIRSILIREKFGNFDMKKILSTLKQTTNKKGNTLISFTGIFLFHSSTRQPFGRNSEEKKTNLYTHK